jgi:hypothetical protein
MNIAVKLYQSITNKPAGIPDAWPAETVTLGESTTLPDGDGWILMTEEELTTQKASTQAAYAAWIAPILAEETSYKQERAFRQNVDNAMDFGHEIIVEFSALNAINQLTTAQVLEISQRLAVVQVLLSTGALYTALDVLENITADELLSQELLDYFEQKIRNYLGI